MRSPRSTKGRAGWDKCYITWGYRLKKRREIKAFPAMKSAENLTVRRKQDMKRGRRPRITFLTSFLIYLCILAIGELCSWVSWIVITVVTTDRIPMISGIVRKANMLKSFDNPKRTDRRESNTGAMGSHWDTSHSQSSGFEPTVADTVFEIAHGRNRTSFTPQIGKILSLLCHSGTDIYLLAHTLLILSIK